MILKFQIFILTLILTTKFSYCIIFPLYCYPFLFVYSQISFSTQINYVEIWPFWSFWCSELLCLMYAFVSLEYYIHVYKYDILTLYTNIYNHVLNVFETLTLKLCIFVSDIVNTCNCIWLCNSHVILKLMD